MTFEKKLSSPHCSSTLPSRLRRGVRGRSKVLAQAHLGVNSHTTGRAFDYTTKLATNSAELRAVASLRAAVFRDEYDKLITVSDCMAEPQKTRAISTVEWDRLEKATKPSSTTPPTFLLCLSAWLGTRCESQVRKAILEESDRSTMQITQDSEPSPVIGSLDLCSKLPRDVELFCEENPSVQAAAYVSNVGVLASARGCGVASALLDFAMSEAEAKGCDYIFTHQHREEMVGGNLLYLKKGYTECKVKAAPGQSSAKGQILLGQRLV